MPKDLKQKAAAGMVWTALQKYSTMFISFISGIILARLLTPYDYGCIGMLAIFMVLAETIIDGGFGSALIQKKKPTQIDYSTIFYWNIGMSVVMYAVLFVSAPAIARFYNIPLLSSVLRVQGLVVFIYAFNIIQRNQLRKKLNFKILSIITITTSLVSLCVTIFMAYKGFGVWALVAQNLIAAAIPALVFWFYVKWRPIWAFSWASFKELFSFGAFMFLTSILNKFSQQLQGLLIGKFYDPVTMGYYSKALGTEKLASHSISQVMSQVTYPLYSEAQDDKKQLANIIRRLSMTLSYLTFPLLFVLLLCARPIFILLYSDRWLQSVPYFQVLCIAGMAGCLQAVNNHSIAAIGESRAMFSWTIIKRTISIVMMVGGLVLFGMKGLLFGLAISAWFTYLVNISLVSKYIGYKTKKQILDMLPTMAVAAISALAAYGSGLLFHLPLYADGVMKALICISIYMAWSFVFKPESFEYTKSIIIPMVRKLKRKAKK